MSSDGIRSLFSAVQVGVDTGERRLLTPRVQPSPVLLLIPGRRLLPLPLVGEPGTVRAGEGVGLEPGDVDDGLERIDPFEPSQAPLRAPVRRPPTRS